MKKYLFAVFILLFLSGCASGGTQTSTGENSPEYVFRFVHEESADSVQQDYAAEFKKVIEEKSNNEIAIEIYQVGQLGDATTQAELLQIGAVDMAIVSPGNIGTMVPESQVLLLHFLFSDNMEENRQILNESKALNELLSESFEEKRMKVLSYWTEGFNQWTSDVRIEQPEDFAGVKFRTMPSPLIVSSYQQYGANPTPMAYEEVYSGLQLSMIDGQTNPYFAIEEMNFYEVQDYMIDSRHSLYTTTTAMNLELYESLPQDIKGYVDETMEIMKEKAFDIQQERNDQALQNILDNSSIEHYELTDEQRQAFRKASMPVREQYVNSSGEAAEEILLTLEKEVERITGEKQSSE